MDVLLCWSKERSRVIAKQLHDWLPKVLPPIRPWMSEVDIDKGKDWLHQLHKHLGEAKGVIVCITAENVRSPWIYYECGQVAGNNPNALIGTYLFDQDPSILSDGPLGRLQHTKAEKEDTFRLLKSFNKSLEDRSIEQSTLGTNFEREWDQLSGTLSRIREMEVPRPKVESEVTTDVDTLAGGNLSSAARTLLLEIGEDADATLLVFGTLDGDHFQTNGKDLNVENTARSTAMWKAANRLLLKLQLLEMRGRKGEVFALTEKGFEILDKLRESMTH